MEECDQVLEIGKEETVGAIQDFGDWSKFLIHAKNNTFGQIPWVVHEFQSPELTPSTSDSTSIDCPPKMASYFETTSTCKQPGDLHEVSDVIEDCRSPYQVPTVLRSWKEMFRPLINRDHTVLRPRHWKTDCRDLTSGEFSATRNHHGLPQLQKITKVVEQISRQKENFSVAHLLIHGKKESNKRRQQFESYSKVHPQINTHEFDSDDSNAVVAEVGDPETLTDISSHFLTEAAKKSEDLETIYIVFNCHGNSDGTLEFWEGGPTVHMDDIIELVQRSRSVGDGIQKLHLVFGQCYGHKFDHVRAAQCDQITNIWWFTDDQYPNTFNYWSEKSRQEHLELMMFARDPSNQQSLTAWKKEKEIEMLRRSNEELTAKAEQAEFVAQQLLKLVLNQSLGPVFPGKAVVTSALGEAAQTLQPRVPRVGSTNA